ncbi:hypothetical protein HC891_13485 [Candidatus Gracilibacteria bacterium]|nr:hypothetical protein [Candidatus Gracilibacteria bacterium]
MWCLWQPERRVDGELRIGRRISANPLSSDDISRSHEVAKGLDIRDALRQGNKSSSSHQSRQGGRGDALTPGKKTDKLLRTTADQQRDRHVEQDQHRARIGES